MYIMKAKIISCKRKLNTFHQLTPFEIFYLLKFSIKLLYNHSCILSGLIFETDISPDAYKIDSLYVNTRIGVVFLNVHTITLEQLIIYQQIFYSTFTRSIFYY